MLGVGTWGDECSAKNGVIRGDGERPLSILDQFFFFSILTEGVKIRKPEAYSSISLPSPKRSILSSCDWSYLAEHCRGVLIGRRGWEKGKVCPQPIGPSESLR